ncbi:ROK family transcriptional regulator [Kineococcus rubinsiae]|uniref:ROK family transcriptional regulator n=1 Tax=Kineococcus rubinsiae TaxID=2609562 RepID=UPI0014311330|nr:ROK family transcriptional regulator [Kineococcus rubinsiae]
MRRGTNLPWVGDYNQAVVLDGIRRSPGTSRTELARSTGLTLQTVSNIVRRLLERELVREDVRRSAAPRTAGKPRAALSVRPGTAVAAGVQFDRDHVVAVLLDLTGDVLDVARAERDGVGPAASVRVAASLVGTLVAAGVERGTVEPGAVRGVGVAVPGPLDFRGPVRSSAINLPGWRGVAVAELLQDHLHLPVLVENDATACAVGELWRSPPGPRSFLHVYVGAGIGGGIVLRDEVLRGESGNAGEIGHVVVDRTGPECTCGSRGCLEACAAPAAVVRSYVGLVGAPAAHRAGLALTESSVLPDHDLLDGLAAAGDAAATAVLRRADEDLADVLIGVVNVVDVGEVVLGGPGLRRGGPRVRAVVHRRLKAAMSHELHGVEVRLSDSGEHAGALGAAGGVLHEALSSSWSTARTPLRATVISPVAPVH